MKPSLMWALAWPNSNGNTMRGLCPRWDAQAVMATRWNMSIKRHSPPAGRFVHDFNLQRIVDLAAKYRLPAIYSARWWVQAGGLLSYGLNLRDVFRRAATYV